MYFMQISMPLLAWRHLRLTGRMAIMLDNIGKLPAGFEWWLCCGLLPSSCPATHPPSALCPLHSPSQTPVCWELTQTQLVEDHLKLGVKLSRASPPTWAHTVPLRHLHTLSRACPLHPAAGLEKLSCSEDSERCRHCWEMSLQGREKTIFRSRNIVFFWPIFRGGN